MAEIKYEVQKQMLAEEIKLLIKRLNVKIHEANGISLNVSVIQNDKISSQNSDVCVWISENIHY